MSIHWFREDIENEKHSLALALSLSLFFTLSYKRHSLTLQFQLMGKNKKLWTLQSHSWIHLPHCIRVFENFIHCFQLMCGCGYCTHIVTRRSFLPKSYTISTQHILPRDLSLLTKPTNISPIAAFESVAFSVYKVENCISWFSTHYYFTVPYLFYSLWGNGFVTGCLAIKIAPFLQPRCK